MIMDEPTLGLDVLSNRIILDFVKREREEGKTILLTNYELKHSNGSTQRGKKFKVVLE